MRRQVLLLLIASFCFVCTAAAAAFLPPAEGRHGMVVSAQHIASQVGLTILKQGGNAIDAAVAIGYALAVVHPCCGNLGGGGFMLIHLADGKNIFIDFRETAPQAITSQLFFDPKGTLKKAQIRQGYIAIGVPGTVLGLNTALKKYGTMTLPKVMAPAIHLAKQGFLLQQQDVRLLNQFAKYFKNAPNTTRIFLPAKRPWQVGDRLKQPQLAHTLALISQQGSRVFYHGSIAKQIVQASQQHGGVLSLQDFKRYRVSMRQPVTCDYRGLQIITAPPPGSGVTVCEALNILSGYSLTPLGFHSALATHLMAEAMRYAFYDRNHFLGDPAFVENPVSRLLSPSNARAIRAKISIYQAGQVNSLNSAPNKNTTNYSVADRFGNAVDVTVTLNSLFGAKVIAGATGFFINNELDDFSLKAGVPNSYGLVQSKANLIAPGKRPLSSMSPTIVLQNQQPLFILGAAGGSTIITTVLQALVNTIDFKMTINAAINQPRFHMQGIPNKLYYEPLAFSADTLAKLRFMKYPLQVGFYPQLQTWGQASMIRFDAKQHQFYGANDNRRPAGLAVGY